MVVPSLKAGRANVFNNPGWIIIAILLTGGLFLFLWLALVARRALPRDHYTLILLLPLGAILWVGGATFMVRGALAPTIPGETGNPQFLAGFILAVLCLTLMLVFNNLFTRSLASDGAGGGPIQLRVIWFTACAFGFLFGQLISELTPVAPQNKDILALFQFICLMIGSVVGIQWVERVHAMSAARVSAASTSVAPAPSAEAQPQQF